MKKKDPPVKMNNCNAKRYTVSRKGFKKQAEDIEWLTQYNGGKEDDAIASLLNFDAFKKEEVEDLIVKCQENIASAKENTILFEKDKGIDRLTDDKKTAGVAQGSKANTGSATEPMPDFLPGQEYLQVIESLQTL